MRKWEHKFIFGSIPITYDWNCPKNIVYLINDRIECSKVELVWDMNGQPYRRYRRGELRCTKCGLFHKEVVSAKVTPQ